MGYQGNVVKVPCRCAPAIACSGPQATRPAKRIAVPLRLRMPGSEAVLSFVSTITVFGTPVDVTLSEPALECLFPADDATREALLRRA